MPYSSQSDKPDYQNNEVGNDLYAGANGDMNGVGGSLTNEFLNPDIMIAEDSIDDSSVGKGCCSGPRVALTRYRNGLYEFGQDLNELYEELDAKNRLVKTCGFSTLKNKLPIIEWLPKYRVKHFTGDLIAGLTVGLTVIPQGLAYGAVAGLSPEYGLYSAFMGCFIYMILGTSKDITLGPTAIMSLLTAEFGASPIPKDATYAIVLSIICGGVQLLMGILHLGFVVEYISRPVINSFTTAAAITIAWGQVKKWFGLKNIPRDFIYDVTTTLRKISETRLYDFLLGLSCLIALFILKRLNTIRWGDESTMSRPKKTFKYLVWLTSIGRNAIVVVVASGVSAGFIAHQLSPFSLTGKIKAGLPPFKPPAFSIHTNGTHLSEGEVVKEIGIGFLIVSLLGLVEIIAIGKVFAKQNGYDIDPNQELLAVGISNILGSFVGAYPVTGSFSRTAVNSNSGVMTPAGGIWTAALVLLALSFLTPLFYYIPDAALAAVIIMAVTDMIDFSLLPKLWKIKKLDLIPWIVTFVCCLFIGIEWGIIIGVGISLVFLLYPLSRPTIKVKRRSDRIESYEIIKVGQGLMFPGIDHFSNKVQSKTLSANYSKSAIVDMHCVASTDYTSVESLVQLYADFHKKKKRLILCNLRPNILQIFLKAKLKHFLYAKSVDEAVTLLRDTDDNDISLLQDTPGDESASIPPPDEEISTADDNKPSAPDSQRGWL